MLPPPLRATASLSRPSGCSALCTTNFAGGQHNRELRGVETDTRKIILNGRSEPVFQQLHRNSMPQPILSSGPSSSQPHQ
ncbi:uncharacterized protein P884DRAFT_254252 [Thermothelomyces heterothallicus CBS 202.75]|uniref:uncharacterized protein n=1 Tax=Thermothelomyces heterothallicus CBS 202.75 TaxID=1149848 RepID=UPI0037420863